MKPVGSAVGFEVEFSDVGQEEVRRFLDEENIRASVTNDASVVSSRTSYGDVSVGSRARNIHTRLAREWARRIVSGGEIVTPILSGCDEEDDWFDPVRRTLDFLGEAGEKPNLKTSIHFHVSFGTVDTVPIEVLKGLTRIWACIEAPIYRVTQGEMGFHRGTKHLDHLYARPIVPLDGPHVVLDSGGIIRPCMQLDKLMEAKATIEFLQSAGRCDRPASHYWPTKYHGINFASIVSKGSIEFRTANFTSNAKYVYAWARMFQKIVKKAWGAMIKNPVDPERPWMPLGDTETPFLFTDLIEILDLEDDYVISILEELWNIGTWVPPVKGYMWTHLGHGLGRRMPEPQPAFSIRSELVPDALESSTEIHRPEEFAADFSSRSLEEVENRVEEEDQENMFVEVNETPSIREDDQSQPLAGNSERSPLDRMVEESRRLSERLSNGYSRPSYFTFSSTASERD